MSVAGGPVKNGVRLSWIIDVSSVFQARCSGPVMPDRFAAACTGTPFAYERNSHACPHRPAWSYPIHGRTSRRASPRWSGCGTRYCIRFARWSKPSVIAGQKPPSNSARSSTAFVRLRFVYPQPSSSAHFVNSTPQSRKPSRLRSSAPARCTPISVARTPSPRWSRVARSPSAGFPSSESGCTCPAAMPCTRPALS